MEQSLLYDFYGELLTKHQKQLYEEYISEDLSFSEIAEQHGISRQGVHDLIKRCDKILYGYEEKLHLVERFICIKEKIETVKKLAEQSNPKEFMGCMTQIGRISEEILEEL